MFDLTSRVCAEDFGLPLTADQDSFKSPWSASSAGERWIIPSCRERVRVGCDERAFEEKGVGDCASKEGGGFVEEDRSFGEEGMEVKLQEERRVEEKVGNRTSREKWRMMEVRKMGNLES